jgi:hypothetical protein
MTNGLVTGGHGQPLSLVRIWSLLRCSLVWVGGAFVFRSLLGTFCTVSHVQGCRTFRLFFSMQIIWLVGS